MRTISEYYYAPLIEDMVWSYSRIEAFEDCRYRWFLKYIYNEKETDMFYASYGTFVHKLIDSYYKGKISKEDLPTEFITGFLDNVKGKRPKVETVQKYINSGMEYFKNFEPFPLKTIETEKEVHFLVGEFPFIGYIDYLGEDDDENLWIIDHKSRDLKPRSGRKKPTSKDQELDSMLRQLYLYAGAVKQEYGRFPKMLCFNCFRTNTLIKNEFNEEFYNKVVDWAITSIHNIINVEEFYPNIDFFSCKYICGLNEDCEYYESVFGKGGNYIS